MSELLFLSALHHCFYFTTAFIAQSLKNFLVSPYGVGYKNPNRNQCTHSKMEKICEICGKTFTRARNLKRHIEAVHQNAEVQCEKCFKKFNRKDIMERHQQKCCVCRLCGVDFSNSLELTRHHCVKKSGSKSKPQKKRTDSR